MKRSPAHPALERSRELEDDTRGYKTSTIGGRGTFRAARHSGEGSTWTTGFGASDNRWIVWIFAGAGVLLLMGMLATFVEAKPTTTEAPILPLLHTTDTTCTITPDGALLGTTTIVTDHPSVHADIAENARTEPITLIWRGRAGDTYEQRRTLPSLDSDQIVFTDTILQPGTITDLTAETRCGVLVETN